MRKYSEATEIHQRVVEARRKVFGIKNIATLTSMNNYAQVLSLRGEFF